MSTLYEHYNTNDDSPAKIDDALDARAQTFTPSESHRVKEVKLKLLRYASPGTITVSITETDGSGHPTGEDLCSGTTDGDTLTTDSNGEWRDITLGNGSALLASTKYAIVVKALDSDSSNYIYWRHDSTSSTYGGGNHEFSGDGGSSWESYLTTDLMFEEWGNVINTLLKYDTNTLLKNDTNSLLQ